LRLDSTSRIADIGFGTGIFTRMLLENGNSVFGIEPNQEMREAGEKLLVEYPNFRSVGATAENTTLEGRSVDFITQPRRRIGSTVNGPDGVRKDTQARRLGCTDLE